MNIKESIITSILKLKDIKVEYLEYTDSGIDIKIKNKAAKTYFQQLEITSTRENINILINKPLDNIKIYKQEREIVLFYANGSQLKIRFSDKSYKALVRLLSELETNRVYIYNRREVRI